MDPDVQAFVERLERTADEEESGPDPSRSPPATCSRASSSASCASAATARPTRLPPPPLSPLPPPCLTENIDFSVFAERRARTRRRITIHLTLSPPPHLNRPPRTHTPPSPQPPPPPLRPPSASYAAQAADRRPRRGGASPARARPSRTGREAVHARRRAEGRAERTTRQSPGHKAKLGASTSRPRRLEGEEDLLAAERMVRLAVPGSSGSGRGSGRPRPGSGRRSRPRSCRPA